jgi:hypothetical protein
MVAAAHALHVRSQTVGSRFSAYKSCVTSNKKHRNSILARMRLSQAMQNADFAGKEDISPLPAPHMIRAPRADPGGAEGTTLRAGSWALLQTDLLWSSCCMDMSRARVLEPAAAKYPERAVRMTAEVLEWPSGQGIRAV